MLTKFHNLDQLLQFQPSFRTLTNFPCFLCKTRQHKTTQTVQAMETVQTTWTMDNTDKYENTDIFFDSDF